VHQLEFLKEMIIMICGTANSKTEQEAQLSQRERASNISLYHKVQKAFWYVEPGPHSE